MAKKDFSNTQTGGVGTTPQVGEQPTQETEVKKEMVKPITPPDTSDDGEPPVKSTDTGGGDDNAPKREDYPTQALYLAAQDRYEKSKIPEVQVPDVPEKPRPSSVKVEDSPSIPLESEKQNQPPMLQGEELVEEEPLLEPFPELDAQEEVVAPPSFSTPFDTDESDMFEDKAESSARMSLPFESDTIDDEGEPVIGESREDGEPEKEEPQVYIYPGTKLEYTLIDGEWYDRKDPSQEWNKITSQNRVFGLNSYHDVKGKIPPRNYNPPKGGIDFEGVKIYGNPWREGTMYTINNGRWFQVKKGEKEWQPVSADKTIKALNGYHGTDVETNAQRMSKAANVKPPTTEAFERGDFASSQADINRQVQEAIDRQKPRQLSNTELAGEILQQRGLEVEADDAAIKATLNTKEGQMAKRMYSTGEDVLFNLPPRPQPQDYDPIGYNLAVAEWDKKYGSALPPRGEGVQMAELGKKIIIEDRDYQLSELKRNGYGEDSQEYQATVADFESAIKLADKRIADAEAGLEVQRQSFKNKYEYMKSDQYRLDVLNSPEHKIAEIQRKMYSMSYDNPGQKFNPEAGKFDYGLSLKERASMMTEIDLLNNQIEREKLEVFVSQDIESLYGDTNMTDSQKSQLINAQKRAQQMIDEGSIPGEAAKMVQETVSFLQTTKEVNNRLAEAYNRGESLSDVLTENKKVLMEQNKNLVDKEVKELFYATLDMRDFISDYVDSGKVIIDPLTNAYSIAEGVSSTEREYIERQLGEYINKYKQKANQIYSNRRDIIKEKTDEKRKIEAAIARANMQLENGETPSNPEIRKRLNDYKKRLGELKSDIRELKAGENTFFMNDPNAISLDVSNSATTSARQLFQAIPDGLTPKDRFDFFYENLLRKTESLKNKYKISQDYWDRTGEKARDVLDWEYLGVDLSPEEIEYYKNVATLQKLSPLYFNNDWGMTEESAGFWEAFSNSFISTFAPNTSDAYGYFNETDAARTIQGTIVEAGFNVNDFKSGDLTMEQLNERIDVDFLSFENAGNMIGTSSAIMFALAGTGFTTSGLMKAGKGIYRLMKRYDKMDNMADAVKDFRRVQKSFKNTMSKSRTGRFFYESADQGLQFEATGLLFNMDEEMNFMSGMGGAMAGKMFEGIFKNMKPSQVVEWVGGMFGKNTDRAVDVFKRMGASMPVQYAKSANYRGLGEMPEEFAQELIGIYREELDSRGFWEEVNARYFKDGEALSRFGELLVSSYVLGAGMGIGTTSTQSQLYEDLPPGERKIVDEIEKQIAKDYAVANANADISANRIVDNYEALEAEGKTEEDAVQEQETDEVDVQEQTRDGEEVVEEEQDGETTEEGDTDYRESLEGKLVLDGGKVGTWRVVPGSGTWAFQERAGMTEADIQAGIEAGNIVDVDSQKKVASEADSEAENDVETETEGAGAKIIPLSEKIRSMKIDTKGIAASSVIPLPVINAAIDVAAKGVEAVEKFIADVKQQDWYKKLQETNPERAAQADAELEQLRADAQNKAAVKDGETAPKSAVFGEIESEERFKNESGTTVTKVTNKDGKEFFIGKRPVEYDGKTGNFYVISESQDLSSPDMTGFSPKGGDAKTAFRTLKEAKESVKNYGYTTEAPVKRVKPTEAVKTIKERISQFKKGYTKGVSEGKSMTKEQVAQKKKEVEAIQNQLLEYARQNLPKGSYKAQDITKMMAKVKNARTAGTLEKALEAVDNEVAKFENQVRLGTADRILSTFTDPLTKKRGAKKVSKISMDAREELSALGESINMDNIPNMTQEELEALEVQMDDIITRGSEAVKEKEYQKRSERRKERAVPFQVLAEQNKNKKGVKNPLKRYNEALEKGGAAYAKRIARKLNPKEAVQEAGRTLESRLMDIYRGSKELREWTNQNILEPVNKAYVDRDNARLQKLDALRDGMKNIFGNRFLTGVPKGWNKDSGVSIYSSQDTTTKEGKKAIDDFFRSKQGAIVYDGEVFTGKDAFEEYLKRNNISYENLGPVQATVTLSKGEMTNGQLVNVGMMLTSDASMIYKVGEDLYASKSQAEAAAKKSGQEVEEFTDKYNPNVLLQISENQSLESGLEKAAEIENYINSNKELADATQLFRDSYKQYKEDYEGTFEEMYDMSFKEGDYVPMTRSMEQGIDTDILSGTQFKSAASAMSNHLKQRYNTPNVRYDFTTDAYTKILEYVNTMEHSKHFLPVAESMRNLMNETTKVEIIKKIGPGKTADLKKHMDRILSDGKSEPIARNPVTRLAQYTVVTTLAGKLASIPKQLTSATHYLGAGYKDGVTAAHVLAQAGKLPFSYAKGVFNVSGPKGKSPATLTENETDLINAMFSDAFIRNRFSGKDIDTETRTLVNDLMNSRGRNLTRKMTQAAMLPTILGDMGGVLTGGIPYTLATYHNNVNNKGMSHEEAMQDAIYKFVQVSNQTQQSQRDDIISNAQRDPLYRIFLTYTTSQVAAMSEFTKAAKILTDRKGGYTTAEYRQAGLKATYYMLSNSIFQIVASGALGMYLMDDDDDAREIELKNTALYNTIMDTFSSNLQGLGLPGKSVDWLVNQLRGREVFNNIPVIDRLYTGVETGGDYLSTLNTAASLLGEGEITTEEFLKTLYYDVDKKTHDNLARITGAKNILDTWESWGQYTEADEDSKMTWWDAFMNRQMDEEGNIYKTGVERGDDLYIENIAQEIPPATTFTDDIQRQMESKSGFRQPGFVSSGDIFADEANKESVGTMKYTADSKDVEIRKRNKQEMLMRIKAMRAQEETKDEFDNYIENVTKDKNTPMPSEKAKKKKEDEADAEMKEWREIYKKDFGTYPPEGANITEIMSASLNGKPLAEKE